MCLPLSLLLMLPVPGLLLVAAVTGLGRQGPLGVAAAAGLVWGLARGSVAAARATRRWWAGLGPPAPPPPPAGGRLPALLVDEDLTVPALPSTHVTGARGTASAHPHHSRENTAP